MTGKNESWNGSAWTELADLNTARSGAGGSGANNTAALVYGGYPSTANTEIWNGTSWSEVGNLNTARTSLSSAGNSTNEALAFLGYGGSPAGNVALTEDWNGASWSEVGDLSTARTQGSGTGTSTNALAFGGEVPPATGATEEWSSSSISSKVLTD